MSSAKRPSPPESPPELAAPWWKTPFMWLVVGGPLTVVVAGFATLAIAITHPDPVLQPAAAVSSKSEMPAVQARNHAATPSN